MMKTDEPNPEDEALRRFAQDIVDINKKEKK